MDLFEIIRSWLKHSPAYGGSSAIVKLFSFVHFELLNPSERRIVRSEKGIVPEEVLFLLMDRASGTLQALRTDGEWDGALVVPPMVDGIAKSGYHCVASISGCSKHLSP